MTAYYDVETLACLHPCSGIKCSEAALFCLNCIKNGSDKLKAIRSIGAQIKGKDQICENILIYQPSLQLAHRNFAAEYFLLH